MDWIKRWYYLVLFFVGGILYLICGEGWRIYAQPVNAARGWYRTLVARAENDVSGGVRAGVIEVSANESTQSESVDKELETVLSGAEEQENRELLSGSGVVDDQTEQFGGEADENTIRQTGEEGTDEETVSGNDRETGESGQDDGGDKDDAPADASDKTAERTVQYRTAEDDYFADAVFIGDSRTVGMYEYGGLEEVSTFYAAKGLNVYKIFTSEIVSVSGQKKKITIEEALQENHFAKIYLMIGINEMGAGTVDTFLEKYEEVVRRLQELQPEAVIYLQGIMKVTTERSNQGDYITNEGIEERNERIAQLADNDKIYYLDVNPLICDETGGMEASYTFDGVHLKAKYIEIWKQFLKEHVVEDGEDS